MVMSARGLVGQAGRRPCHLDFVVREPISVISITWGQKPVPDLFQSNAVAGNNVDMQLRLGGQRGNGRRADMVKTLDGGRKEAGQARDEHVGLPDPIGIVVN